MKEMTRISLIALQTLTRKEVKRIFRIWKQTLIPPMFTAMLYILIFGYVIGKKIGSISHLPYLHFIAPGLVMMAVINNAYNNSVSSFFSEKFMRSIDELICAPVSDPLIIIGFVIGALARALTVGFLVTLMVLVLMPMKIYSIGLCLLTALLAGIVFALAGLVNAVLAKSFDDISFVPTFVLLPMIYLGGVFYDINQLPPFWQMLSKLDPIYYLINMFRYAFTGVGTPHVTRFIGIMLIFTVVFFVAVLQLMKRRIKML